MRRNVRYRLIRTLASGGMAQVYEAIAEGDAGFERRVAIKRVLPELAGDAAVRRMFFDEARIASCLHHGNIVQVLDYGLVDGSELLAMELVDGVDARRAGRLAGAPMPEPLALHVCAEIAHALEHAHGKTDDAGAPLGIVHRDVSPQNILLSWDGDVKLTDFGIALATERTERTTTGIVKGKLAYMAPEQAAGRAVGPAADVWALGATLHAIASGDPPDGGLDPALSAPVRELIDDCMSGAPDGRPSAAAVASRAGRLAARAMDRDARGWLREWLAPLRDKAAQRSKLDDVMGLALVAGEGRRFTVSRADASTASPAAPPAAPVERAPGPSSAEGDLSASVRLPLGWRPSRGLLAASAVAALLTGGLVWSVSGADPPPPGSAGPAGSAESPPRPSPPASVPEPGPQLRAQPAEREAAPPSPAPPDPAHGVSRRAPRVEAPPPAAPAPEDEPEAAPDDPPPSEAELAWVRVPRGGDAHERITVDGRAAGFTPTVLALPVGSHRVVVVDAGSGEVLADRSVVLAAQHTRVAPLVFAR